MNKLKLFLLLFLTGTGISAMAQNETATMSLQQAIDYALQNNPSLKNADIDIEIAKKQVLETASMGLPKINGQVDYTSQPQIGTTVVPNFIDPTGPPLEFQMGISHSASARVTANWLLVDGTYFLGLKAASQYVELASRMRAKTEIDTRVNVSQAYYMSLIADQSILTVDSNLVTLQKTYEDTKALYDNGFAEKIDVSRLALQLGNLKIQRQNMENQRNYAYRILKFQMGMDVNKPLVLTGNLREFMTTAAIMDTSSTLAYTNRPDYQILTQKQVLNNLNVRRYQMGYLPSLSAFGSHTENTFATKNNFGDLGSTFYGGTSWGLSLSVPIFSGFQRNSLVQQARLETIKTRNNLYQLESAIQNEVYTSKNVFITSLETVENQRLNYELSLEIREIAQAKFEEGVGTSLEVTAANSDMLQAETNYLSAVYDILVAEINYKKALGLLK